MLKEIKDILSSGDILIVEFTKKNGDKRTMKCTTSPDRIPEAKQPQKDSNFNYNTAESVRVYDVEAEDWRSFRVNSVNAISSVKEL